VTKSAEGGRVAPKNGRAVCDVRWGAHDRYDEYRYCDYQYRNCDYQYRNCDYQYPELRIIRAVTGMIRVDRRSANERALSRRLDETLRARSDELRRDHISCRSIANRSHRIPGRIGYTRSQWDTVVCRSYRVDSKLVWCACLRARACVRVHACACMRACMRACVCVHACMRARAPMIPFANSTAAVCSSFGSRYPITRAYWPCVHSK
jgi:hypothetical protein